MEIIYTLIKIIAGGAILLGGIFLAIVIISAFTSIFNKQLVNKTVHKIDNAIDNFEKKEKPSDKIRKIFPKLKGIDFDSISKVPDGQSPIEYVKSKIDGGWYFSIQNFAMIIKSFSDENYEKALADLLYLNNLDSPLLINEESTHFYYEGNGFKIEKPKTKDINLIVISNESLIPKGAVDLRQNTELNEITVDWVNGIEKVYEGDDALKRFDLENHLANIALLFIDKEDNFEYLLIYIRTHNLAPTLIRKIIDENGGDEKFKKLADVSSNDIGNWKNLYQSNDFVIGYLPKHRCVRLNQLIKYTGKIQEGISKNETFILEEELTNPKENMNTNTSNSIIIEKTRFFVDEALYKELLRRSECNLIININPVNGKHPKGQYVIPNKIAIEFINSKRGAYNWEKNKTFHQDGIPKILANYFKYK